jgi:hypothetical protein
MSRRTTVGVLAVVVALLIGACGDDRGTESTTTTGGEPTTTAGRAGTGPTGGSEATSPSPSLDDLPEFATVADLRDALVAGGLTCELEYEGLEDGDKVVSICVIAGEQALLSIWNDPGALAEFTGSDAVTPQVVYGANWTIDLSTPQTAALVAAALAGRTG